MKKIALITVLAGLVLSFSGCKFFSSLFGKGNKFQYETVSKTDVYEISKNDLKKGIFTIPGKVEENQNVFFIQVNTGKVTQEETGALIKNETIDDFNAENSNRSVSTPDDSIIENKVPSFVRNFKGIPKIPAPNYNMIGERAVLKSFIGDIDSFNLPVEDTGSVYTTDFIPNDAELKYKSNHAYVYYVPQINFLYDFDDDSCYEKMGDFLQYSDFKKIGDTFDSIFEAETALLGSNKFTSKFSNIISASTDKITILLCDIYMDSTENQRGGTFGYFSPVDFYIDDDFEDKSNETQIIYIDSVLYKNYPKTSLSTLSHEFCHLLNYCNKEMTSSGDDMEEATWFTEMMAMVTEDLMYSNYVGSTLEKAPVAKNRIPYYLKNPESGFTTWDGIGLDGDLIYYGNSFAYGSFLLRNYGGVKLLKNIATNKAVNEEAITKALSYCGFNVTYKDTLRDFAVHSMNAKISKNAVNSKTLNIDVKESLSGYDFHAFPIDVSEYGSMRVSKNENSSYLNPTGFSVHYAGKGVSSIEIRPAESSSIQMYCVVQTVTE